MPFGIRRYVILLSVVALSALLARGQAIIRVTEKQEIEIGRRAAIEIEMEMPIIDDPELTRYLDSLGQRLARESGRSHIRYRFRIINGDEINAFALPGGFIYVYRGLIEATENESELAGALGHEIGHVVARHHVSQIRKSEFSDLGFWVMGPVIGRGTRGIITRRAGGAAVKGLFSKYSREDEREADRLGAKNLHDAGFDPRGMITLLERLAGLREAGGHLLDGFYATHPSIEERADNIADILDSFPPRKDPSAGSPEFDRIRKRFLDMAPPKLLTSAQAAKAVLPATPDGPESGEARNREIAAIFAPLFYQGLGSSPRYDYITNFDFDGDWRGDNNWKNAADAGYQLKAYVYYAVRETQTHLFIHYAAFHPRDYKGGNRVGRLVSKAIRKGVSLGGRYDPTGRADEAVLAHENDLEGCLVVAVKDGDDLRRARTVFVETLAHNRFYKYVPETRPRDGFAAVVLQGQRPKLFVEPRGHGIEAYTGDETQLRDCSNGVLLYTFTGRAENPERRPRGPAGYDLVPIASTLWPRALKGLTPTFAETYDYGTLFFKVEGYDGEIFEREVKIGNIGAAFRGTAGGLNLARPPWAWFDGGEKDLPLGDWFFDPARTIKKHFNLEDDFRTVYLEREISGVFRCRAGKCAP